MRVIAASRGAGRPKNKIQNQNQSRAMGVNAVAACGYQAEAAKQKRRA
jgi:hypothetical protein